MYLRIALFFFSSMAAAHPVGCIVKDFEDTTRARKLSTEICFPASNRQGGWDRPVGAFKRNSKIAAPILNPRGRYPLMVISHGTGGHAGSLAWFSEHFASLGYVVVTPHHPGSTFGDLVPEQLYRTWNRPLDIKFVLDELEKTDSIQGWYDPKRIVMAGFSMGGYTTLAMAGARFSIKRYDDYCARTKNATEDCQMIAKVDRSTIMETHDDESFHDPRIQAFFSMSPYGGPGMEVRSLNDLQVPIYLFALTHDEVLNVAPNARYIFTQLGPGTEMSELDVGTHYALLGECTKEGFEWVPELCKDTPKGVRPTIHRLVLARARAFFRSR